MSYHSSASTRALGRSGPSAGQAYAQDLKTSLRAPRVDARSTGARAPCVPAQRWARAFDNEFEKIGEDSSGRPISVNMIVSEQLESICNCVQNTGDMGHYWTPLYGAEDSLKASVAGSPNSQTRIDFCWSVNAYGLSPVESLTSSVRSVSEPLHIPARLQGKIEPLASRSGPPFGWVANFPDPCKHKHPPRCEEVVQYERQEARRGFPPAAWYERTPQGVRPEDRRTFPVDSPTVDSARHVFRDKADSPFFPNRTTAPAPPGQNIPYLNKLKAAREAERTETPLRGISGIYNPSLPQSTENKHNLMVAGTAMGALCLMGVVALVTRKK